MICAFHGLNARFNALLQTHCHTYYLDFHSVSKFDMHHFLQQHLRRNMNRTVSLRLSNEDRNIKQVNCFLSHNLNFSRFINLRFLSLYYINNDQIMQALMSKWPQLPQLTHLKLIKCHRAFASRDTAHLSTAIWSLKKLTHCWLDTEQYAFCSPRIISVSLERISILGHYFRLSQLAQLLRCTPGLRSVSIQHHDLNDTDYLLSPIIFITSLTLFGIRSRPVMLNLLQKMPNLSHLTIETFYLQLDGDQWETFITKYIPTLKTLRFKMNIQLTGVNNNEQKYNTIFDSFRSRFWIKDRQWFVRSHQMLHDNHRDIIIYTLPPAFTDINNVNVMSLPYKSTNPSDKIH